MRPAVFEDGVFAVHHAVGRESAFDSPRDIEPREACRRSPISKPRQFHRRGVNVRTELEVVAAVVHPERASSVNAVEVEMKILPREARPDRVEGLEPVEEVGVCAAGTARCEGLVK